ncbi:NAD(P)/FAD-dependent oxidoreductase [Trinickia caryophylli]|uniref:Thioredoxin reductase n=1 Tax=Trinickia caryophylli TaxID=28094 RepID=A0A1X7FUJ4_TRICW|nr:NAD(P)/FAD-dependent oxidoreductase [Trinickia caryophylli]PMS11933.1 FAD-dependent oxidoreductase [Trinickia caryophylli]TRX13990.1 FAD-dependent oxidoreductase [Trinickia caryophylli]WQE15587.1 NAD(P)/FAD-dependent oxidoreductase [Trinickia caryophylli]SMF58395.1 Thioredoxin reductase [Trinickia caryophylli]GLU33655.1 pyridine nucleotide-disulfide oxidoreductase [Trinickia caryophylli]
MSELHCDLFIVGAGPAGMAAAIAARAKGLSVIVADEGAMPGGQIYRRAGRSPLVDPNVLGTDYLEGGGLVARFLSCGARYLAATLVWQVQTAPEITAWLAPNGAGEAGSDPCPAQVTARAMLLATGAQERPWPVRGWTLPGVMGVGAAQTLMKSAGLVPGEDTVLVGSGPLLWLYASQLIDAGRTVRALLDTTPGRAWRRALPHLPRALLAADTLTKGLRMMAKVRRSGIEIHRGVRDVEIAGETAAHAVRFRAGARQQEVPASLVLLHQGVVPGTNLARALGCRHRWDRAQACWHTEADAWGRTSVARVWIAGDGAGIGGAQAARCAGEIAALDVVYLLGHIDAAARERESGAARRQRTRHLAARPLLDALYTPERSLRVPADDVVVCRCEEVTAGEIRRLGALGCTGPNQAKAFSRCGMGPCQGRWCGITVGELLAEAAGRPVSEIGYYRIRPPIKPVTIEQIAAAVPEEGGGVRADFPS